MPLHLEHLSPFRSTSMHIVCPLLITKMTPLSFPNSPLSLSLSQYTVVAHRKERICEIERPPLLPLHFYCFLLPSPWGVGRTPPLFASEGVRRYASTRSGFCTGESRAGLCHLRCGCFPEIRCLVSGLPNFEGPWAAPSSQYPARFSLPLQKSSTFTSALLVLRVLSRLLFSRHSTAKFESDRLTISIAFSSVRVAREGVKWREHCQSIRHSFWIGGNAGKPSLKFKRRN